MIKWIMGTINSLLYRLSIFSYPSPVAAGPKPQEAPAPLPSPAEEVAMGNEADTLVTKYPDRISQLQGPVYDYLKKGMPYTTNPQDLYMQVFYPVARKWAANREFSNDVKKVNPGIKTPQDYVNMVERAKGAALNSAEEAALSETASRLGVTRDSLYKLISFESGWDPKATNPYTGARGLIQFMPATAKWMGYAAGGGMTVLLVIGVIGYFILKQQRII